MPPVAAAWILLPLVVAYVVLAVLDLRDLVDAAWWAADSVIVAAVVEGTDLGARQAVVGGSFGFTSLFLFSFATEWLPGHRVLWQLQPILTAAAAVGLVAWTVRRVAGTTAALVALVMLVCVSPAMLDIYLRPTFRGTSLLAIAAVAAFAVELARPEPFGGRRRTTVAVGVVVALVLGLHLVDNLLWAAAVAPLVAALVAWRVLDGGPPSRRALRTGIAVLAGAVVIRQASAWLMAWAGYDWLPPSTQGLATTPERLLDNAQLLAEMVMALGGGGFEGVPGGPLAVVLGVAMLAGVLASVALAARGLLRPPEDPARLVHLVFWGALVAAVGGAVLVTTLAVDLASVRYIAPMLLGVAATVPLLLDRGRAWALAVVAVVAVYAVGGIAGLARGDRTADAEPARALVADVERVAAAAGVDRGYGDYHYAGNVTWLSDGDVTVRPVLNWVDPDELCAHVLARDLDWYRPRPGRSFLLWPADVDVPASLGAPDERHELGVATMYVFGYDLAERLCPPPLLP